VQGLVYLVIALAALGVAAAAYFGLTFTPIEAAVTAASIGVKVKPKYAAAATPSAASAMNR
jgi:hypothetical protein